MVLAHLLSPTTITQVFIVLGHSGTVSAFLIIAIPPRIALQATTKTTTKANKKFSFFNKSFTLSPF